MEKKGTQVHKKVPLQLLHSPFGTRLTFPTFRLYIDIVEHTFNEDDDLFQTGKIEHKDGACYPSHLNVKNKYKYLTKIIKNPQHNRLHWSLFPILLIIFCASWTSLVTAMAPPPSASLFATLIINSPIERASLSRYTCLSADNIIIVNVNYHQ